MELQELYQLIDLQPEMRERLQSVGKEVDLKQVAPYLEQLTDMKAAAQAYEALKSFLQEDIGHMKMLYCQLQSACRVFEKYKEKHIEESVYIDTMKCFTRFIGECEKKNGRMFFDRGWWTYRQTSMSIFRIGALEYEFQKYEGENIISVHIPSDADMTNVSVNDSFEQARKFFQMHYGDYAYDKYVCDSWLLSPVLKSLLSEASHIVSFQKRFAIVQEERESTEFIEWLFQVPEDTDYSSLPEKTNLQKKVKELLLNGGSVGSACGIMKLG